jgi:hypothetical protein
MEYRAPECPACGSVNVQFTETAWETGPKDRTSPAAPPVPRAAATTLGRFYAFGGVWLLITIFVTLFLRNFGAARVESVFNVTVLGVMAGIYQIVRLVRGSPKPTDDQIAALAEWQVAYAEWERTRICLDCGTTFVSPSVGS